MSLEAEEDGAEQEGNGIGKLSLRDDMARLWRRAKKSCYPL